MALSLITISASQAPFAMCRVVCINHINRLGSIRFGLVLYCFWVWFVCLCLARGIFGIYDI